MILAHNGLKVDELTLNMLKGMSKSTCFAKDISHNKNISMIPITWEAWRLSDQSWTIFYLPEKEKYPQIRYKGTVMRAMINVRRLVNCSKEALKAYIY